MKGLCVTLALCVAVCSAQPSMLASATDAARWQGLIAEYLRNVPGVSGGSYPGLVPGTPAAGAGTPTNSWYPSISNLVPTLLRGESGHSLPVLVVPIPVPFAAPANSAQCSLSPQPARITNYDSYSAPFPAAPNNLALYGTVPAYNPQLNYLPALAAPVAPAAPPALAVLAAPAAPVVPATPVAWPSEAPPPPTLPPPSTPAATTRKAALPGPPPPPPPPPAPSSSTSRTFKYERLSSNVPSFPPIEDSSLLVELFRKQEKTDVHLPPIVQKDFQKSIGLKRIICKKRIWEGGEGGVPPPPPRFEGSMYVRGRLTVKRAGFTEPFSLWWDVASAAFNMDFHDGSTSTYRLTRRDGRVQSVQIHVDRTGERDVRRCLVTPVRRMTLAERSLPALPDLQSFSFAGYVQRGAERTERWRYTLSGHSGELGGARGEALTFRHELLVRRASDNYTTTPLRYTVTVDSSVLGTNCDNYVIHFDEVLRKNHNSAIFKLNIEEACDNVERTRQIDIVEPLREFTMVGRDPRYDNMIDQFKRNYQRVYLDDVEEAVRKNVLMQIARYTESGNRQGASFDMEINFLSDRLDVERNILLGVGQPSDTDPGDTFPHSLAELEALRGRLPADFDWRERGAVTHVRFQKDCASCWAIATTGAVEGALFVETNRLVPLSEQAVVDCSMPWGGQGCMPTWPSSAYNYMKDRGLPAFDEYKYLDKKSKCRANNVPSVTRISGHVNITADNPTAIKVAIKNNGPVVVLMTIGNPFFSIKNGSYYIENCEDASFRHAMLAVGWMKHRNKDHLIVKNSLATKWGNGGYVAVDISRNTCGVLSLASYPRLRARDVQRLPADSLTDN